MADSDSLDLSVTCAICLEVASVDSAVETSCCHHLFCLSCIENVQPCPSCRKQGFQTIPAYFARRLIGNLITECPNDGCTAKMTRSNLANHLSVQCTHAQITCPDPQCANLNCTKTNFIKHLSTKHEKLLLENFAKLWEKQEDVRTRTVVQSTPFDDRLERTRNKFGRYARLGSSGKFYCGGELDGLRCTCCNGHCGPSNGCNCSGCMILDVQKKRLPPGWLVNCEGASARCSREEPTKILLWSDGNDTRQKNRRLLWTN